MFRRKKLSLIQFIVYTAIFGSLATVLLILQFPLPIGDGGKVDLSDTITLLAATINPLLAVAVTFLKIILTFVFGQAGIPIGQLSVFVASMTYIIMFELLRKSKVNPIIKLILIAVAVTVVQSALNYFIVVPVYFGQSFSEAASSNNYLFVSVLAYLPLNIVKSGLTLVAYYIINKVLERV